MSITNSQYSNLEQEIENEFSDMNGEIDTERVDEFRSFLTGRGHDGDLVDSFIDMWKTERGL